MTKAEQSVPRRPIDLDEANRYMRIYHGELFYAVDDNSTESGKLIKTYYSIRQVKEMTGISRVYLDALARRHIHEPFVYRHKRHYTPENIRGIINRINVEMPRAGRPRLEKTHEEKKAYWRSVKRAQRDRELQGPSVEQIYLARVAICG